jgi:3-deoxy-manno-octulosonate cytidylyltransferase (CMP-KDO synthetase)
MKSIAIIPVRMGSSRFPGKPLKKINGIPMVEMIYKLISKNKSLSKVVVATCDKIIFDYIKSINGEVVMTSIKHQRASDRTAEALIKCEKKYKQKFDVVVMVQGDEPMVDKKMIQKSLEPFKKNKKINVVNLISKIKSKQLMEDPNCIKVVKNLNNEALYFSRSPIPHNNKSKKNFYGYKQVCIIPFKKEFLLKYIKLKPTELEEKESIDMMRILENGYSVNLVEISKETFPVDTLTDLQKVIKIINEK